MRTRYMIFTAVVLLACAAGARAQDAVLPSWPIGSLDLGMRVTDVSGDPARFQRYRDWRDGERGFLDRFRFDQQGTDWLVSLGADHVGYRDQRYAGEFQKQGKIKASFEWDQVPLFYSVDTRTLYTQESAGVFRVSDDVQRAIEGGTATLAAFTGDARSFDARSRRDAGAFKLVASPNRELDLRFNLKTVKRDGQMPWGASFGFSEAVEIPAPLDMRTTDVGAALEWAGRRGMVRVGYDGSWFDNKIQTFVWDNPLKFTDSTFSTAYSSGLGTSQGRMAFWPSNTTQSVSTSGMLKLPRRTQVTGYLSLGTSTQNEPIVPFTINTAIAPIPLERPTAEAEARVTTMNYTFTSRPNRYLVVNARYRYSDFDNRTPHFPVEQYVRFDQVIEELASGGPEPFGYTRHTFDADLSLNPIPFSSIKVGYTRALSDRTFRFFERTAEDVFRVSFDTVGNQYVMLRALFETSERTGSRIDEEALAIVGEQPEMRHYDIADRDRHRFTALLAVTPIPALGFNASVAVGKDDYKNSGFGLRDNEHRVYTVGVDVSPADRVSVGITGGYENYTALQWSRTSSASVLSVNPAQDWSVDSDDTVRTLGATCELLKVIPKTELRFAYDYNRTKAAYLYGGPMLALLTAFAQLPPVTNELQSGTADARYFVTEKVAVGVGYWYDRYRVSDFALGAETINRIDLTGGLLLGYVYRPYTANTGWVRLMFFW